MLIESIFEWNQLAKYLSELGYTVWQMQYSVDNPEGFRVWFFSPGKDMIEVITFDKEVYYAILEWRA